MTDLLLDPDDGRDVDLKLPRHVFTMPPPPEPSPLAQEMDEYIRRLYVDYIGKVSAEADRLGLLGLALEEVEREVVSDPFDPTSDRVTMRIRGTYRIRQGVMVVREGGSSEN